MTHGRLSLFPSIHRIRSEKESAAPRSTEPAKWPYLQRQMEIVGYGSLAADPAARAKIKAAAVKNKLALWTAEHLVTLDESRIDARPAG